jgi:SAM-dependent methyltransferase
LPFPDASFDIAVCQFGLMFVPDKDRAFHEMRRVLVNGGLLAFNVWDRMEHNPYSILVHETVASFFPNHPPQFFKAPFSFSDIAALRRLLTANGFGKIEIQAVPAECLSSTAKSLILAEIQERGGSSGPIVDAVTAALVQLGGDNPFRSTMQAIVVTARASRQPARRS